MSLVHELAASVQCCFELFGTQSDGVLLSRHDQCVLNEVSSILQPVLLRLQKQAVSVAESSELFAEDEQLLGAVVELRRALQSLQASVGRCRASHWLLRVLTAEDVRRGLEGGLAHAERALQQLVTAEGAADVGTLHEVAALQSSLRDHKVTRHDALERLGTGLYKHMEQATDAEQVVSMLRFVVREAQNLMMRRKHSRASSSSSSSSRRDSDASDTSTARVDQDAGAAAAAAAAANNNSGSSNGTTAAAAAAGAPASTSSMDTGSSSDGSSSSGSRHKNKNNSSKDSAGAGSSSSSKFKAANKPGDIPPGETSLTDVALLLAVQQLADAKQGTQQLVLHQILSILEELHEQKAHQLKHKHRRAAAAANGGAHPSSGGPLQSVPEGSDDTIAAVRAAAAAAAANGGAQGYYGSAAAAGVTAGYYSSGTAAAVAAARLHGSDDQPVTYGSAVAAVSGGLEQLLLADPWDTAALTQLLELLLQAAAEDEFVEVEEDSSNDSSSNSGNGKPPKDGSSSGSKGGRKWWQVGSLSKASKSSFSKGGSSGSSSKSAARAAADEAAQAQQRQRQERVHQLVASALDVLLRLTPLPAGQDSTFKPASRPDMSPVRSLALPLMAHCDTAKALSGCIWSSWPDVQTKAARLLAILLKSEASLTESAGIAAASGLASSPASIYAHFCHSVCSSDSSSGSAWHGLITLLHGSNLGTAAAGAEAIAAVGACSHSAEVCSSMAASQATRALLNLLSKHGSHLGAAGAAAAALHALGDPRTRPAMHELLVSSYTDQVNGASVALGESCIAVMLSSECLAACRAARLATSVAHGINWSATVAAGSSGNTGASSISAGASLWGESFRAGQHLLQRSRDSACSGGAESSPTAAGAGLLRELVVRGCPRGGAEAVAAGTVQDPAPGAGGARSREDLCLEALVLVMQKLQSYDVSRPGKEAQVQSLVELLEALVGHMSEVRVCGALPELFASVVPQLEALQRSSSSSAGSSLRQCARALHEQLMALGG